MEKQLNSQSFKFTLMSEGKPPMFRTYVTTLKCYALLFFSKCVNKCVSIGYINAIKNNRQPSFAWIALIIDFENVCLLFGVFRLPLEFSPILRRHRCR